LGVKKEGEGAKTWKGELPGVWGEGEQFNWPSKKSQLHKGKDSSKENTHLEGTER